MVSLRERFDAARLEILTDRPGIDVDEATRLLVNRLLHTPTLALREMTGNRERQQRKTGFAAASFGFGRRGRYMSVMERLDGVISAPRRTGCVDGDR